MDWSSEVVTLTMEEACEEARLELPSESTVFALLANLSLVVLFTQKFLIWMKPNNLNTNGGLSGTDFREDSCLTRQAGRRRYW